MVLAQLIFGIAGWLSVASAVPLPDVIFWRCLFGAGTLLVLCWSMGLLRRDALTLAQLGLAALAGLVLTIAWLLLFGSLTRASISIATAVFHLHPLILVGFGVVLFNDKMTFGRVLWLVIAFLGVVLIVQGKPAGSDGGSGYLIGVLMAFGAACCYVLVAILTIRLKAVRPHLIALVQITVGALLLLPFVNLAHAPTSLWSWSLILIFGVVGTGIVYLFQYSAYQKLPTHMVGILAFIYPAAALFVDYVAFDQRLQLVQLVGTLAVLLAAFGIILGPYALKALQRRQ
jgi:drug/metabolite transporter (DMT)-like permease